MNNNVLWLIIAVAGVVFGLMMLAFGATTSPFLSGLSIAAFSVGGTMAYCELKENPNA